MWFGKPIWQRTYNGVVYSLGSIPFGGFVKLPQLAPMDMIEGETTEDRSKLPVVSPWDKIIVALAGPVFSFGLAFVFAVIVYLIGRPLSEMETSTTIGYVVPNSPAATAQCETPGVPPGLRPGDLIQEVDNHPVTRFGGMNGSVVWYVARSEGMTIPFNRAPGRADADVQSHSHLAGRPERLAAQGVAAGVHRTGLHGHRRQSGTRQSGRQGRPA